MSEGEVLCFIMGPQLVSFTRQYDRANLALAHRWGGPEKTNPKKDPSSLIPPKKEFKGTRRVEVHQQAYWGHLPKYV